MEGDPRGKGAENRFSIAARSGEKILGAFYLMDGDK
jgi:hypothetical protein